jgi:hypothetical protein
MDCLDPPLKEPPETEKWYCPKCFKNPTHGKKKKEKKLTFADTTTKKNWGKGST